MKPDNLAQFVRTVRYGAGVTQSELADVLGNVSPQYISKIETGRIKKPTRTFLQSIAEFSQTPMTELASMLSVSRSVADNDATYRGRQYRLVFGHCLWGAPIFLAAHRGMLPEFQVASFSKRSDRQPAWITADAKIEQAPRPGSLDCEPWSAVRILDALEKEEIDVGAVPGNILWGRRRFQRFSKIGTVVDSATGCTFVANSALIDMPPAVISTRKFGELIMSARRRLGKDVRVGVETGTVAEDYLHHAFTEPNRALPPSELSIAPSDIAWHCENSELVSRTFEDLSAQCRNEHSAELLGMVTWEPHASWLANSSIDSTSKPLIKLPLYFNPDSAGRLTHMSFDLVTLITTAIDSETRVAFSKLIQKVWQNAVLLTEMDGSSFDTDPLNRVARYFGYASADNLSRRALDDVRKAVAGIRYSVHWAMESPLLAEAAS